jgi:class 3 adenylate cyclase
VNLASRLCDNAEAGVVLAAADDLVLPDWVDVDEARVVPLKGLHESVSAVSLVTEVDLFEQSTRPSISSLVSGLTRPMRALRDSSRG